MLQYDRDFLLNRDGSKVKCPEYMSSKVKVDS